MFFAKKCPYRPTLPFYMRFGGGVALHSHSPSMACVVFFASNRDSFLVSIQEGLRAVMGTTRGAHDTTRTNRKDRKTRYDGAH